MASNHTDSFIAPAPQSQVDILGLLDSKGGFTITLDGAEPQTGFSVAVWPDRSLVVDSGTGQHELRWRVRNWLSHNADILPEPGVHIGGWRDSDTGLIWLDFVKVFDPAERDAAIEAGVAANQIAIWSLHDAEEIRTGGTGTA